MGIFMIAEGLFGGLVLVHHIFEFSWTELCLFVIVAVVPILKFFQIRWLEFWFHDGGDFEEEIKLFN